MNANRIYNADNLELMQSLPIKSIDLIYIDPPFSTNRRDLGYCDSFDTTDGFVQWLSLRLGQCYLLLKDTGVLCTHLDYRTVHYVKVVLDRVFGENNFVNEIIWYYTNSGGRSKRTFAKQHDSILAYSKSKEYVFNGVADPQERVWTKGKSGGRLFLKNGKRYQGIMRDKKEYVYCLDDGKIYDDVWNINILQPCEKERTGYLTQKPLKLLERFIKTFTNEGHLVADFFCGSGTTLVAAKKLGRQYLGCDINPKAVKITQKRLDGIV